MYAAPSRLVRGPANHGPRPLFTTDVSTCTLTERGGAPGGVAESPFPSEP
jgi:hypothetical protein